MERVEWNPTREGELASTGQDGTVRLWDVRVGAGAVGHAGQAGRSACVKEAQVGDAGLFLAWHPGGQQMVVGRRDDVIVVVDVRKGVLGTAEEMGVQERGKLGSGQTNQCAFSNSGRELFATTSEGTVKVLDWPSMVGVVFGLCICGLLICIIVTPAHPPCPHQCSLQCTTLPPRQLPRRRRRRLANNSLGHIRLGM